ncbi:hypothetical protein BP5796_10538 [Coleophoma crateriformis]|uniref:Elongator complex protein 6 n=1 Tax=Coleophoma crateriformis TaxID=565419 RepID=A0A3D8QQD8_9HELO|nr:hypothetical protein BP5796_10538 [Coleophoma crateriformis]
MASRIPPLLEPYLSLPPETSLILLTSVLGASTNWLVLRFLHSILAPSEGNPDDDTKVVFVSFMRDLVFWKENGRRIGLDLDKLAARKKFAFVDGLSGLFLPKQAADSRVAPPQTILKSPELQNVASQILGGISQIKAAASGKVLLVLDQLDLLLATAGDKSDVVALGEMLLELRESVHATVMTVSADYPLVSEQRTSLESNHAEFLMGIAHQADSIMSLRLLDTGTARDVSGVIRVTQGSHAVSESDGSSKRTEEKEVLYFVGGDGGVKVFERGQ